ncbi:MAG: hypothetical protein EKK39_07455 [Sphingobacteriales bacterium]|uniref:hypothetical protein n=1 Tax=Hydrotalea flava TaxID=714549 RepID=UPI00082FA328|nr:hypothetical protein [Hydrotalea flava]RTL52045.1 MAG: hypothetical protein EKK39_07455 [Sphingobacteriales bacterium]
MAMHAVLTCDIVNSTRLPALKAKKLMQAIQQIFSGCIIEFYRGDSFQVYLSHPKDALKLALQARLAAIQLSFGDKNKVASDIKISIGLGTVEMPVKNLKTARGEAFLLSGRLFDTMAALNQRLVFGIQHALAQEALQILSAYVDAIFNELTAKQAAVLIELMRGEMQQTIALKMKKSKSTIHQHVVSARWQEIEALLKHYENIIQLIMV